MRSGELAAGTPALLARVGIGVAVRQGAPLPDVSTTEGFKQALLSARAVACIDSNAGGTSGIYLAQLLKKMAVQQKSDLVAVHGAKVVGPFPAQRRFTCSRRCSSQLPGLRCRRGA